MLYATHRAAFYANILLLGGRIAHLEVATCLIFLIPSNRVKSKKGKHWPIVWLVLYIKLNSIHVLGTK
jgi:hypothetical protein